MSEPKPAKPAPIRLKGPSRGKVVSWVLAGIALVVVCNPCTLAIGIRAGALEAFEMDGPSMAPAYQDGDRVWVSKAAYGLFLPFTSEAQTSWAEPELGEVAIIRSPLDDIDIIKRIIGLPGDTISIVDDVVFRDGEPLARRELGPPVSSGPFGEDEMRCFEESAGSLRWTILESSFVPPDSSPPLRVPPRHVFVLGDNRDRSNDSRNPRVGMIPFSRLKGLVGSHYHEGPDRVVCPTP